MLSGQPIIAACHVRDAQLVDRAVETYGRLDVAFNNAGIEGDVFVPVHEQTPENYSKVFDVNVRAVLDSMRAEIPAMLANGGGVIVNNASVLGWRAQKEQCHYAAAKAGVMALTRCAAMEAAEFDVRINAVSPSIVLHPMLRKSASEELLEELESKEAYGRAAEAWEVANVMMFLASDYSSYMTGEVVSVSSQRS